MLKKTKSLDLNPALLLFIILQFYSAVRPVLGNTTVQWHANFVHALLLFYGVNISPAGVITEKETWIPIAYQGLVGSIAQTINF